MRKSTKKTFRRGTQQRYMKYSLTSQQSSHSSPINPVLLTAVAMAFSAGVALTLIPKNSFQNVDITKLVPAMPPIALPSVQLPKYSLPNLPNISLPQLPKISINYKLPEIQPISLPKVATPNITVPKFPAVNINPPKIQLPRFSLPSIPFGRFLETSINAIQSFFGLIANLISQTFVFMIQLIQSGFTFIGSLVSNTGRALLSILRFFDPRPYFAVIQRIFILTITNVTRLVITTAQFINPKPFYDRIQSYQIAFVRFVANAFINGIRIAQQILVVIGRAVVSIVRFVYQIVLFTLQTIVNVVTFIAQKVSNFFAMVGRTMNAIKVATNKRITAVWKVIEPYVTFLVTVFQTSVRDFKTAAASLHALSIDLMETYKENSSKSSQTSKVQ